MYNSIINYPNIDKEQKMFDPKKTEYINKTFRLPINLIKQLEIIAQEKQISLNSLIAQCCEYAIDNMDSELKEKANKG